VRRSLIAAAFVALGVALVAGIVLATRLARRLTALRDVALAVADRGPGSRIVEDGGRDEIGDLARAFAIMQHRLDDQERSRRTFVSTASHELRTPLTSLRLMLHAAQEELAAAEPDLEETRRQVTKALGQSARLGRLSEELLDLSRLDAGVELRTEPVDLAEVARSVLAEFDLGGDAPRAALTLEADAAAWASADPGGVARILRILVDNALRHTPSGGEVAVRVDGASIEVADTGPGVSEEDADRVFRRFQRGPETRDDGGFGLGLAIGRELARQMAGDLCLRRPGPGATFVVRLPAHDAGDA
jgi:signal transduction histidine kinase